LGGIPTSMCIWSLQHSASMISIPFLSQSSRNILPMFCFIFPYNTCLRYFAANIMWYLHSHVVFAKVFLSIRTLLCYLMWLANLHYSNIGGFLYLLEAKALFLPRQSQGFIVFTNKNHPFYGWIIIHKFSNARIIYH
jgi:hypothetical protein